MKKITISVVLALAIMMLVFVGCSAKEEAVKEVVVKNSVIVGTQSEPVDLSTTGHHARTSDLINQLTYEGLVRLTENLGIEPCLAESWENVTDVEWLFHIREGVKFHNGETMTAHDVVATLNWAQTCNAVKSITLTYCSIIEAVDDYTVRIVTETPKPGLIYDLHHHANLIVPKSLIDSGNNFNTNPIGTGPYKYISWTPGEKIEYVANEDYWDREVKIKYLTWKIMPEGSSRTIALQTGDIDLIADVLGADIDILQNDENIIVDQIPGFMLNYMMFNNDVAPFDNVNFRKAVNAAVNKDDLVTVALNGLGVPSTASIASVFTSAYTTENADEYSVDLAKQYLEAWGGDVSTVHFRINCSNETKLRAAEIIQGSLAELGISCEIESTDGATYIANLTSGDYECSIGGMGDPMPLNYAKIVFLSGTTTNKTRFNDPLVDELIGEADMEMDPEARSVIYKKMIAQINAKCPVMPMYVDYVIKAYRKDLTGVTVLPTSSMVWSKLAWK